tara:strand:- start:276 stop:1325 length:1050 start_codon:yes stop_codon:yes gene_type:complete
MKEKREKSVKFYFQGLKEQKKFYLPGAFWKDVLEELGNYYIEYGTENFRNSNTNAYYFVPTYGTPTNGFSEEKLVEVNSLVSERLNFKQFNLIKNSLFGHSQALSDYRVFSAASMMNDKIDLSKFSESAVGQPKEYFEFDGKRFSRSSLNYLLGLSFFKKKIADFAPKTILEIGGGFGTLGEILGKSNLKDFQYINLDLPPMFLISEAYLKKCMEKDEEFFDHKANSHGAINILELPKFTFLPNWRVEDLRGEIDLFVNFISFQEMEPHIVSNYAKKVVELNPKYILLRNLREGKQKKVGKKVGVEKPIIREDYLSYFKNYELLSSDTDTFGYKTTDNFHSELLLFKKS